MTRREKNLLSNLKEQLHHAAGNFQSFAQALKERTNIFDISLFCIFVRGMNVEFKVIEDLLRLKSMGHSCRSDNIFRDVIFLTEAVVKFRFTILKYSPYCSIKHGTTYAIINNIALQKKQFH